MGLCQKPLKNHDISGLLLPPRSLYPQSKLAQVPARQQHQRWPCGSGTGLELKIWFPLLAVKPQIPFDLGHLSLLGFPAVQGEYYDFLTHPSLV